MNGESEEDLFDFAYFHERDEALRNLADMAEPEDWSSSEALEEWTHPVLFHYLKYTFKRLVEEDKIAYSSTDEGDFACFNTGLVTPLQEEIFAYFVKNRVEEASPWRFFNWLREGEYWLTKFKSLPERANYFDDPKFLVYDTRMDLVVNKEHILNEHRDRFPPELQEHDDHTLSMLLDGAIRHAKKRVMRSYKAAVPQYYGSKIQLLLPLCIRSAAKADLALVVDHGGDRYRATTVLSLSMAYSNARQIAKPDRQWLNPLEQ
ncbi:MAG: DUF3825 domain-containing protein [Candidatus Lokiarchaeota archaeon]|nr:DUF3825 domain-containing protein [Candidatus Lokiarchaeota archaeon]